MAAQVSVPHR